MSNTEANPKWYHYLFAFLSGVFLMNLVPHFINGVTGNHFPTPFANPPGVGLSSPAMNIVWALINFALGFVLLRLAKIKNNKLLWAVVFSGSVLTAFYVASYFGEWRISTK